MTKMPDRLSAPVIERPKRLQDAVYLGLLLTTLLALAPLLARAEEPAKGPEKPSASLERCPAQDGLAEQEGEAPADREALGKSIRQPGESDESEEINGRADWRWFRLTYPTGRLPYQPFTRAMKWIKDNVCEASPWARDEEAGRLTPEGTVVIGSGTWTFMGPRPIVDYHDPTRSYTYGHVTGRFDSVAVDPRTVANPDGSITAFAGGATGGLWKSTNCCGQDTVWVPHWEGYTAPTQACGAIEFDPNDPDVIYAGTGSFDAPDQVSEGLMKSTDSGETWTQLGADVFTPNAPGTPRFQNQAIGAIRVDPNDSQTVLAGTRFDLYISHDGGHTWSRCVFGANPTDPTNAGNPITTVHRISGILLDPATHPTTVYVAVGYEFNTADGDNGVYRGTLPPSGTPTLTLVSTSANGWPSGTGSGTNGSADVGRIRLTSSRGNPSQNLVIYAQVQSASGDNALGTWVTTDQGTTWKQLAGSADTYYKDCSGLLNQESQDWYDLFILADPLDDKVLTIGRTSLYRATVDAAYSNMSLADIGAVYSLSPYSPACAGYGKLHPDQHAATPIGQTGRFLLGNDGGLYAGDGTSDGFTQLNDTINATEWYAGQTSADMAGAGSQYLLAGAQDNGSASWDSSSPDLTWQGKTGGDGFYAAFDPLQASLSSGRAFAEVYYGRLYCSPGGLGSLQWNYCAGPWYPGDRPGFLTPFKMDIWHCATGHCDDMVLGAAHLWASASSTAPSWVQAGKADLTKGQRSISTLDVALSSPTSVIVGTEDGNVQWSNNVYAGSGCTQAAANSGSFACSPNANATWVDLTGDNAVLPNRVISSVTFDPTTDQKVYAAVAGFNENTPSTPGHLLLAACSGNCASTSSWSWTDKSGNLPDVPAESVAVNPNNPQQVFVGTEVGFFYTDDVTQNPPVWVRYPYGLPNTVIQYLALDRGPEGNPYASTTLTAFTYGRGVYSIRLPAPSGFQAFSATATASTLEGTEPLPVSFSGAASGGTAPYTYAWDFGDGNTSGDQNPQHTFASAGTYTIRLVVIDNAVRVAAENQLSIHVAHALTVSASASLTAGVTPITVAFHSSVSGGTPPYSYAWTFGDGGTSSDPTPSHSYASAGVQNVALTVTDAQSHTGFDGHLQVTVTPPPPVITQIKKAAPFKLVVAGSNLQPTFSAFINGAYWKSATWKSSTQLQLLGGKSLKQAIPKGTPTQISILNGDGGIATATFSW